MTTMLPYRFYVQVRAAGNWRNITSYPYDQRAEDNRAEGRGRKLREARIGRDAWRNYHEFHGEALRIAECVLGNGGVPEWIEVSL